MVPVYGNICPGRILIAYHDARISYLYSKYNGKVLISQ